MCSEQYTQKGSQKCWGKGEKRLVRKLTKETQEQMCIRHFLLRILLHSWPSTSILTPNCPCLSPVLSSIMFSLGTGQLCLNAFQTPPLSLSFRATEGILGGTATDSVLKLQNGYADTLPTASRVLSTNNRNNYLPFISSHLLVYLGNGEFHLTWRVPPLYSQEKASQS